MSDPTKCRPGRLFRWLDLGQTWRRLRRIAGIASRTFNQHHGPQAAAGMAYYALFTVFPLLLFLVALGSLFVQAEAARQQVYEFVNDLFPVAPEPVLENLDLVLRNRGAVGVIATVSLLWSASGFFVILARNVSLAWSEAKLRSFLEGRLVAFAMIGALAILLFLSTLADAVYRFVARRIEPTLWASSWVRSLLHLPLVSKAISTAIAFLFLLVLYRQVPRVHVGWKEAAWSALLAAAAWRLVTMGFTWYLGSGLARYSLVYGSLNSVVALLFYIYLCSYVILFGAHICAAIALARRVESVT